ncbi:MAG: hypothetical protein AB1898_27425 [Acidobacteriota bacterium]
MRGTPRSSIHRRILIFLVLAWGLLAGPYGLAQQVASEARDDFELFEDRLSVLTRLSEKVTLDLLSLKRLTCRERILVREFDKQNQLRQQVEQVGHYEVVRQPDQRVNEQLLFRESRRPLEEPPSAPVLLADTPLIDNLFTGVFSRMFSLENRLANDFKEVKEETVAERRCVVLEFETVPELNTTKILVLGKPVPLRLRGMVWIDAEKAELVRVSAKQTKLPKGCRTFEYVMDYTSLPIGTRTIRIPVRAELGVELKDKRILVEQSYFQFQAY